MVTLTVMRTAKVFGRDVSAGHTVAVPESEAALYLRQYVQVGDQIVHLFATAPAPVVEKVAEPPKVDPPKVEPKPAPVAPAPAPEKPAAK